LTSILLQFFNNKALYVAKLKSFTILVVLKSLRPSEVFFTAVCSEQVFSLKPWKKFGENLCCRLREKLKNHFISTHSNSAKMTSPRRRLH